MSRFSSQVSEVINRNTVVSLALGQGFNAFLPVYDGGVDFILYRESDRELRKVQLKGRWTIDKKYEGRDIWIAFPIDGNWYLMKHDDMVATAAPGVLQSVSWTKNGLYSKGTLTATAKKQFEPYRFAPIADVATEATKDDSA
jgi:hypothetical protein